MRLKIILLTLSLFTQPQAQNPYPTIGSIPLPDGYHRIPAGPSTFTTYLCNLPLKKNRTVYLYDGSPKRNQDAQYAVINISVGNQDLQQCADAVMRLRAEYLYAQDQYNNITFFTEQERRLNFKEWLQKPHTTTRQSFDSYLNTVFNYCSTRTLQKQLLPAPNFNRIDAGNVLIRSGSPGHAMLVVDIAENAQGHRIYLLAQSYMPAQDIHIVNNPANPGTNPWYSADNPGPNIETPEWMFRTSELRQWP